MLDTLTHTPIRDTLQESFVLSSTDGFWYPQEAPEYRALVRILVSDSGYCVERRRKLSMAWYPIAAVPIAEFDPQAFRTWRRSWATVAA